MDGFGERLLLQLQAQLAHYQHNQQNQHVHVLKKRFIIQLHLQQIQLSQQFLQKKLHLLYLLYLHSQILHYLLHLLYLQSQILHLVLENLKN